MLPTLQNIFIGLCKWKKFSLIFWFMFPLFVTEFWNKYFFFQWEKVLDLEGTLEIDHLVRRLYFTTEKTKIQSLVICPRTFTDCWQSGNENLGFLTNNLIHIVSFRILKISFMVKGNEFNNYSLIMKCEYFLNPM